MKGFARSPDLHRRSMLILIQSKIVLFSSKKKNIYIFVDSGIWESVKFCL